MTKYIILALVALAVAAGVFAKIEHTRATAATERASVAMEHAKQAEKALAAAQALAKLQREVSLARQQELNRLRVQAEAQQKALNEALQAHPDWARTPVPDSVWDALDGHAAGQAGPGVAGAHPQAATGR